MCGRFLLLSTGRELAEAFDLPEAPHAERYNIAPGTTVPVVLQTETGRRLKPMRWGLIPSWAKDPSIGFKCINARSETAAQKPVFRTAFKRHHCLVPASGFYEWRTVNNRKMPTLFRPRSGVFAFAGLWETWQNGESPLETFTILTTSANDVVRPIHDRMPVILNREDFDAWLVPSEGKDLLRQYPAETMTAVAVNPWVNDARHEGPRCIEPTDDETPLFSGA